MDVPRVIHDEVFLELEQPQLIHLADDVRNLGHGARFIDVGDADRLANESTPLIMKAGNRRVYMDKAVDLEAIGRKLRDDERAAITADRHTPARELLHDEGKHLVVLSIPITLTLLLEVVPLIVLAMMMGNVSGAAAPQVLAASSLADFFQSQVVANVVNGLGAAISTMCAQSFGAKQFEQFWIYVQAGLIACAYCLPVIALVCLQATPILQWLGQDTDIARIAGKFIFINFLSVPFTVLYTVARSAFQAQNIATPFVMASAIAYAISLPLAYGLGYYTSLGYIGVALSNVVGNMIKVLAVTPVLLKNKVFAEFWPGWEWQKAHFLARKLWPISAGSVLMATFQTAGFTIISLLCGLLPNPAVVMTANSIASTLVSLAFLPLAGLGASGIVRVGNALGAGQARRAFFTSVMVLAIMVSISMVCVGACWWAAPRYAKGYTTDKATVELAIQVVHHILPLIPLAAILLAAQCVFQASGAQWLCAKLNFVFLFAIGAPFGLLCAIPLHRSVFGLWDGNMFGVVWFIIAAAVWVCRLDWQKTAHEARLNAHLHVDRESLASSDTELMLD